MNEFALLWPVKILAQFHTSTWVQVVVVSDFNLDGNDMGISCQPLAEKSTITTLEKTLNHSQRNIIFSIDSFLGKKKNDSHDDEKAGKGKISFKTCRVAHSSSLWCWVLLTTNLTWILGEFVNSSIIHEAKGGNSLKSRQITFYAYFS